MRDGDYKWLSIRSKYKHREDGKITIKHFTNDWLLICMRLYFGWDCIFSVSKFVGWPNQQWKIASYAKQLHRNDWMKIYMFDTLKISFRSFLSAFHFFEWNFLTQKSILFSPIVIFCSMINPHQYFLIIICILRDLWIHIA